MPSSIQTWSPGWSADRNSGWLMELREAVPFTGFGVRVKRSPVTRLARPPTKAPSLTLGPCRSWRMVIGRPHCGSASRIARITSPCSACLPWEKLSRATSMPAATSRSSAGRFAVAGPIVHTILVFLMRESPAPHPVLSPRGRGNLERSPARDHLLQELARVGPVRLARHVMQRLELLLDGGHGAEEVQRRRHRHVQHVGDVPPLVAHLERLPVVALPLADLARDVDIREEVHLDLHQPVTLASLATPALDVEGEPPWLVPPHARIRRPREQRADEREHARVGGGVGARRAPDGRLVDVDDLVEMLGALDAVVGARALLRVVEH